ncbi:hypothetical protein PUV54_05495 [Hyphococcus flavus]|uniref:Glycosyltransferase family 61 protein n=1 Tax=Hyphococcus flavus TaxID=1866326 RepID=A0AAE9ZD15_9PROT|nr:hypothetical protein [Hyphococcus flavus]WDI32649.1 hypothetical protein PUV54_05495 [Hyphococcus flavus]
MAAARNFLGGLCMPAFKANVRGRIGSFFRLFFTATQRYAPFNPRDTELKLAQKIHFSGDAPVQIESRACEQGRMVFARERPESEDVKNLVVTPNGGGWVGSRCYERYSASAPGLRVLLGHRSPAEAYETGYWVQSAHKDTYGDWVSEYLSAIIRHEPLNAPLFLPAELASRPYVCRDLARLAVDFVSVDRPMKIKNATVLRQQKYFVHFRRRDVAALRKVFAPPCEPPSPGSLVYLSRYGEVSEVADRQYPNEIVERVVADCGGRVIRTADAHPETYRAAALEADTVVFDHGSAFYNALGWRPRKVIEIVSDGWWNNAFVMLADAMGIEDYTIIRGDLGDRHVAGRLKQALSVSA